MTDSVFGLLYVRVCLKRLLGLIILFMAGLFSVVYSPPAGAVATQSTLTISTDTHNLAITVLPSSNGTFATSNNNTVSIMTDNFTGYTLMIATDDSTSLINEYDDEIESISSAIDATTFSSGSNYINKWGYKPSQYVTSSGGVDTTVQNSNFLPAPSTSGDLFAKTSAANSSADTYTVSFGAKVGFGITSGTYSYTYNLIAVANAVVYNVTYDDNTSETVTNMPSPNPQALSVDGGTPAAQSYGTLSGATPVVTSAEMTFDGWCDVPTTVNSTTGNYECSGTVYDPGDQYPIDQTAGANITLYAIWLAEQFPIVWSQMGKCEFHGATSSNITGTECQDYTNVKYIDTGIALYSNENYLKDYEIHFTIEHYSPSEQNNSEDSQQTFVSDKLATSASASPYNGKAPGVIVRRSGSNIQVRSTFGQGTDSQNSKDVLAVANTTTEVSVYRINHVVYARFNGGPLQQVQDVTGFNQQFALTTWFGAYPADDCTGNSTNGVCTNAKRYIEADFSNMYIRLGDFDESNLHEITFRGNGGVPTVSKYLVIDGAALGILPEVTWTDWAFTGWYTQQSGGSLISANTVPVGDDEYWAHWVKAVSQATIANTNVQLAVNTTDTVVVSNSAELESYTFTSNDTAVATVNSTTGEITGVSAGSTTITMTGSISGLTQTINVTVGNQLYSVAFDAQGGSSVSNVSVADGGTISELPRSNKTGYALEGWYSGTEGSGTKLTTSTVFDSNTPTQYYAYWVASSYVCKIAPADSLHQETCSRTDNAGCNATGTGYSNGSIITYGTIPDSSTMRYGDAYNCDVNANGVWDSADERFYYIGMNGNNAKFVYYRSTQQTSDLTYDPAIAALPTTSTWSNANLQVVSGTRVARFMTRAEVQTVCGAGSLTVTNIGNNGNCVYLLEQSNYTTTTRRDGIWLAMEGSSRYRIQSASRQITSNTTANTARATIEVPIEYVEPWSAPPTTYTITFNSHNGEANSSVSVTVGQALGSNYPSTDPTYTDHVFQGWYTAESGGTLVTSATVPDGDLTYHAQWKKSVALAQIVNSNLTVTDGNTITIGVVNSAELEPYTFSSNDTTVATVDSTTGAVTGVAIGSTTITMTGNDSHDTQTINVSVLDSSSTHEITFDSQGGSSVTSPVYIVLGDSLDVNYPSPDPTYADHVFQGWYTQSSGGTLVTSSTVPTGDDTYYAQWKLNVQQAIIADNDLTLTEGSQITVVVSNSASLEPYTFSSGDSNIASIDANTGVITGVSVGNTTIVMTGTQSGLTYSLPVDVLAIPPVQYTVTYNANGGSSEYDSAQVDSGNAVGSLPNATRTNYKFFGWYTDDGTFFQEVTPDTVISSDVTFYAKWVEDTTNFPIVWSEVNACTFGSGNVSGTYCSASNKVKTYIDTGIQLFTQANYDKDFEVGFTIVEYTPASNNNQATFVNSKQENKANNYPGFVVRRYTNLTTIEITEKWSGNDGVSLQFPSATTKSVRIMRRTYDDNGTPVTKMYYSINGGAVTDLQDITNITRLYFDTKVWFGAGVQSNGTSSQRPLVGTLTDMYVRLGVDTEYLINLDPNGGTVSPTSFTVAIDDPLGTLPTPTPPNSNYTFDAWYDESVTPAVAVSSSTVPDGHKTYVAHWNYTSSNVPISFDVSNDATRGYQTIINSWVQSPTDITTFNENSPINTSTWGDTTQLTEAGFWSGLKSNFETNQCMIPSYGDAATTTVNPTAWANGSVDCSKPDAYDTRIGAALDVYLYDLDNSTLGAQVTYAKADDGVIHNMIPGQTYYWEKASDSTVYGYVTATSPNGRRWVDTGQIRNTRDLGGLPVTYTDANNNTIIGTLEYGKLFRGERLWSAAANATELTNLGITKEYDLSGGTELSGDARLSQYQQDTVVHYNFDVDLTVDSNYMKAWTAVTDIMTDVVNNKNIFFHCRVGADRTGTVAYLLEGLLGVPDEARYEEYSLTHLSGLYDRTRYYKQKAANNALKFVFMMDYVLTTQDIYNWYMANPNASASLIQQFRSAMVNITSSTPAAAPSYAPAAQTSTIENEIAEPASEPSDEQTSDASNRYVAPLGVTHVVKDDNDNDNVDVDSSSEVDVLAVAGLTALTGLSTAAYVVLCKRNDA